MPSSMSQVFDRVCNHSRQTALLTSIDALLGWDERCLMPHAAGDYRAEQMTLLAGMIHDRQTDPRLGDWLSELAPAPGRRPAKRCRRDDPPDETPLRQEGQAPQNAGRRIGPRTSAVNRFGRKRGRKGLRPIPAAFGTDRGAQAPAGRSTGLRGASLRRLFDEFEQDEQLTRLSKVLAGLREAFVPLVAAIAPAAASPMFRCWRAGILSIGRKRLAARCGCALASASIVAGSTSRRIHFAAAWARTTAASLRVIKSDSSMPAFSAFCTKPGMVSTSKGCGLEQHGLPLGEAVSLGIHESQSRMWENLVGRSRAFWTHFFPAAQKVYPEALQDVSLDEFYFAVNDVRPSLVRVEADEATYNLHILIRFELEQDLFHDDLDVADLPAAWNAKYTRRLGITPPDDAQGVLQDIHWSAGAVRLFPDLFAGKSVCRAVLRNGRQATRRPGRAVRPGRIRAAASMVDDQHSPARPALYGCRIGPKGDRPAALARPAWCGICKPNSPRCMDCERRMTRSPTDSEPCIRLTATHLAEQIRTGELSATEVVEAQSPGSRTSIRSLMPWSFPASTRRGQPRLRLMSPPTRRNVRALGRRPHNDQGMLPCGRHSDDAGRAASGQ